MELVNCAPQIRTTDLALSVEFYKQVFGFQVLFEYEDFYIGMGNAEFLIHFKLVDSPDPSIDWVRKNEHLHLHLRVKDCKAEYKRIEQMDVKIVKGLTIQPWGLLEFVVEDPDGHTIYISQQS